MSKKKNYYHYDICGLDYVYLANGYKRHKTPFGEGVSIDNVEELHKEIGLHIVSNIPNLRGQEIRFFRSELGLSQLQMSQMVGTTLRTYQKWEEGRSKNINPQADRLIRVFYLEFLGETALHKDIMESLQKLQEIHNKLQNLKLMETSKGWKIAA